MKNEECRNPYVALNATTGYSESIIMPKATSILNS